MDRSRLQAITALGGLLLGLVAGFATAVSLGGGEAASTAPPRSAVLSSSPPGAEAEFPTPTLPAANAAVQPSPTATSSPAPEPTATTRPSLTATTPPPTPTPRSSCSAIEGTAYTSPDEREFYLSRCPTPTPRPAPTRPATTAAAPTVRDEQTYRNQASAQMAVFSVRHNQAWSRLNGDALYLELAATYRQLASSLDAIGPPPPAYSSAHDNLRNAALAAHSLLLTFVTSGSGGPSEVEATLSLARAAVDQYASVLGLAPP